MQCHKCPYNGKSNERCIECRSADYLSNSWQSFVHSDKIEDVIDAHGVLPEVSGNTDEYIEDLKDDCSRVIDVLRTCHARSLPYALSAFLTFAHLTPEQAELFDSVLSGKTLKEHADFIGVSKQAIQQKWKRMVSKDDRLSGLIGR